MNDFSSKVILGASGLETSRMGLGSDAGIPEAAVEWAFEHGIDYFYWGSRRRPGMKRAIRRLARSQREEMLIALQTYDPTGLAIRHTFESGLRALSIEYADVFILGLRNGPLSQRVLDRALELKQRHLVRHLCVSAHDRRAYRAHLESGVFDLIMVRYNAAHRGAERDVFPLLDGETRPGVLCYNSTRWGHLFDPRWMPADVRTPDPSDLFRYALSNPAVDMVLTAPQTLEQLQQNLRALERGAVTPEERSWLEAIGDHVHAANPSTNFDFLFQGRGPSKPR